MMDSPVSEEYNDHDKESPAEAKKITHSSQPPKIKPKPVQTTAYQLCEHCDQLDLTATSFIVNHQDAILQRPLYIRRGPRKGKVALRTGEDDIILPSLDTIATNALTCGLCKLIVKTIRKFTPHELNESQVSSKIRWEVDGHQELSTESFRNRTRRLRLTWKDDSTSEICDAFFIMVDGSATLAPNSDVALFRSKRRTFRGRDVQQGQGKQALIKSWLDICRKEHKGACGVATQRSEFNKLVDETYFGVIDVTDLQLKPLPRDQHHRPAKFVALSYVWGQSNKSYVTTRLNVPWRRQHGGLETDLHKFPPAIRDAIQLVQKLNLRYLWIDALCIVQDSAASFRLNAAEMHTIYGNAHFTICAADGNDADTGLCALRNDIDKNTALQDTEEVIPGLRLQITRPPEIVIKGTKWNTRGWTFQERILSRRCVVFADGRAYFQCRKAAFSEDVHNDATGSGWSLQAMGAPLRSFPEIGQRSISFYMKCVAMFYRRDLTRPNDILAAFKGIHSVMELVMRAPFCYGLPTSHLDLALLWQPTKAIRRRVQATRQKPDRCTTTNDGHCDCKLQRDDLNGEEFPSWSWCGWVGGDISYDAAVLDGCLLTVREWLRSHTWIRYHVLDGRGKLRPLWDASKVMEDTSSEERWRGYTGIPVEQAEAILSFADCSTADSDSDTNAQVGVRPPPPQVYAMPEYAGYRDRAAARTSPEPGYAYLRQKYKARSALHDEEVPIRPRAYTYKPAIYLDCTPLPPMSPAYAHLPRNYNARRAIYDEEIPVRLRSYEYEPAMRQDYMPIPPIPPIPVPTSRRRKSPDRGSTSSSQGHTEGRQRFSRRSSVTHERMNSFEKARVKSSAAEWAIEQIDSWGRPLHKTPNNKDYREDRFTKTHPENPYRVCKTAWSWPDSLRGFSDLPILQFWTMLKQLRVISAAEIRGTGLTKCHIGDAADDWCGTVTVNSDWIEQNDGKMANFIALSEAKSFTEEEDPNWNYYTPKERGESEWEVYYALLIVLNKQKHVWERVGLAKIFKGVFDSDCWTEIMLG